MKQTAFSGVFLLSVFLGGCANPPERREGKLIVESASAKDNLGMTQTPYGATYILARRPEPAAGDKGLPSSGPWTVRELSHQEPIGFKRGEDGQLLAVAGREWIPLDDGAYSWRITPESERGAIKTMLVSSGKMVSDVASNLCTTVLMFVFAPFFVAPVH